MKIQKLSVIVPVYNEKNTILKILDVIHAVPLAKEIIVIDDGSTDGTRELLRQHTVSREGFKVLFHEKNSGKGAAIRTGIQGASGDAVIIQDADLEYNPMDFMSLVSLMESANAQVIYGSRFSRKEKVTASWHRAVNGFLTTLTNCLYGAHLTDMETCYKLFRRPVIQGLPLTSNGFEIEVEMTAKLLRSGYKIVEAPISYKGRTFHEGKKIGWKDGVRAVQCLFYYRFSPFKA